MKTNLVLNTNNQKGYSLIEIIIVITIFSTLAGITISAYISMKPSLRLSGTTRQIIGDLMWARMQSISQNNEFKIFFLPDNHRYTILDDDNNNGNIDENESTVIKDIHDKYYDVTFSSTNNPIFHPRGNASNLPTIILVNSSGTKTVSVAMTGHVRIE